MATIALVGNKGGAGKTTLSLNLAAALGRLADTVLLDADPQRSALRWGAMNEREPEIPVLDAVENIGSHVQDPSHEGTHLVIDCPPSVEAPQTRSALRTVDVALIPVQPSPLDIWATIHIEREVDEARRENPGLKALLVINQLEPQTRLSKMVRRALEELTVPAAETAIRRRMAYRMSALEGRSVFAYGRRGAAASDEIQQLTDEVMRL